MRKRKIWQLQKCDREYAAGIAADLGVSPVVVSVLLNRGVREKEEIREFLFGSEQPFHEPLLMKDMQKAAERILEAVKTVNRSLFMAIMTLTVSAPVHCCICICRGLAPRSTLISPKEKMKATD